MFSLRPERKDWHPGLVTVWVSLNVTCEILSATQGRCNWRDHFLLLVFEGLTPAYTAG